MKSGITMKDKPRLKKILRAIKAMPERDVLVGIPEATTNRQNEEHGPMTNARLGYIHENGAPEHNIPARPFLLPGIRAVKDKVSRYMAQAGAASLAGDEGKANRAMHAAGLVAATSAKNKITEGIPPPLKSGTLRARARRKAGSGLRIGAGARDELNSRAQGNAPGVQFAKPLIDSGQLLASITYVVRD